MEPGSPRDREAPNRVSNRPQRSQSPSSGGSSRTWRSTPQGRAPAPSHRSPAPPRPDPIRSGTRRTPRGAINAAPAGPWPVDAGGVSRIACRSPGSARSTREQAAHVRYDSGSWAGWRPSLGGYVTGTGPRGGCPPPEGVDVGYPPEQRVAERGLERPTVQVHVVPQRPGIRPRDRRRQFLIARHS